MKNLNKSVFAGIFTIATLSQGYAEEAKPQEVIQAEAYKEARKHLLLATTSFIGGGAALIATGPVAFASGGSLGALTLSVSSMALAYSGVEIVVGSIALGQAINGNFEGSVKTSKEGGDGLKAGGDATTPAGALTLLLGVIAGKSTEVVMNWVSWTSNAERLGYAFNGVTEGIIKGIQNATGSGAKWLTTANIQVGLIIAGAVTDAEVAIGELVKTFGEFAKAPPGATASQPPAEHSNNDMSYENNAQSGNVFNQGTEPMVIPEPVQQPVPQTVRACDVDVCVRRDDVDPNEPEPTQEQIDEYLKEHPSENTNVDAPEETTDPVAPSPAEEPQQAGEVQPQAEPAPEESESPAGGEGQGANTGNGGGGDDCEYLEQLREDKITYRPSAIQPKLIYVEMNWC